MPGVLLVKLLLIIFKKINLMEKFLNILCFTLYAIESKIYRITIRYNPVIFFFKKVVDSNNEKKRKLDKGLNFLNKDYLNIDSGRIIGTALAYVLFVIIFSLTDIFLLSILLLNLNLKLNIKIFGVIIVLSLLINHFYVFNKYKPYFQEFEKWDKSQKRKNITFSILYIIFVSILFLYLLTN